MEEISPEHEVEQLKERLRDAERVAAECRAEAEEMEYVIYGVAHNLSTALRTIRSYAELLERRYALDEDSREMTSFMVKGANDAKILLEDVLKYSRIKTSPERRMVSLQAVVQCAALNVRDAAREIGAEIQFNTLPEIAICECQFVQLFEQLFTNSFKFRGVNQPIIEVSAEEGTDAYVISVRDNGLGIDPKYQDAIFTPLKRLHGREVPGTGFGLAICRKIVRAHGGQIWVESDGAHGSTFRFTVPF